VEGDDTAAGSRTSAQKHAQAGPTPLPGRTRPCCLIPQLTGRNRPSLLTWLSGHRRAQRLASRHTRDTCLAAGTGLLPAFPVAGHGNALSSTGKPGSDETKATQLNHGPSTKGGENGRLVRGTRNSHVKGQMPVEAHR